MFGTSWGSSELKTDAPSWQVRHILLAFQGTEWEEQVLSLTARLARSLKAKLTVIHVTRVPPRQPVDAADPAVLEEAERLLARAERVAQREKVQVYTDIVQARDAGVAAVEAARELGADLLVAAGQWSALHPQLPLGETVSYLLRHAHCPVWLACAPPVQLVAEESEVTETEELTL
jgi:nucleotide-binding universal stress UspA family protein